MQSCVPLPLILFLSFTGDEDSERELREPQKSYEKNLERDNNSEDGLKRRLFCFVTKKRHAQERADRSAEKTKDPQCFFRNTLSFAARFPFVNAKKRECGRIYNEEIEKANSEHRPLW